jgi:hypothetical protein
MALLFASDGAGAVDLTVQHRLLLPHFSQSPLERRYVCRCSACGVSVRPKKMKERGGVGWCVHDSRTALSDGWMASPLSSCSNCDDRT